MRKKIPYRNKRKITIRSLSVDKVKEITKKQKEKMSLKPLIVERDFIQYYVSEQNPMFSISPCEHDLLDYILIHMNREGFLHNDKIMRDDFRRVCDLNGKTYGDDAIAKSFKQLISKDILWKPIKGYYRVNPQWFWKGDMRTRIRALRESLDGQYSEIKDNEGTHKR